MFDIPHAIEVARGCSLLPLKFRHLYYTTATRCIAPNILRREVYLCYTPSRGGITMYVCSGFSCVHREKNSAKVMTQIHYSISQR